MTDTPKPPPPPNPPKPPPNPPAPGKPPGGPKGPGRSMSSSTGRDCCVYFVHAADGTVLYIGQSSNVKRRLAAHRTQAEWWADDVTVKVVTGYSRAEARAAEALAIAEHRPPNNNLHNPSYNVDPDAPTPFEAGFARGEEIRRQRGPLPADVAERLGDLLRDALANQKKAS